MQCSPHHIVSRTERERGLLTERVSTILGEEAQMEKQRSGERCCVVTADATLVWQPKLVDVPRAAIRRARRG